MGRGSLATIVILVLYAALMAVALWPPQRLDGTGTLYGDPWCAGIKFDAGRDYFVIDWPGYLHAARVGHEEAVVDQSGRVLLREGDRVAVKAHLTHIDGDSPCSSADMVTVESYELLPAASRRG